MKGNVSPVAIVLIVILVLGVVLGVKPIRQKIFGARVRIPIIDVSPTPNGSRVTYYEVDNEPDLVPHWKDDPARYARVLHFAYTGVKSANPSAPSITGRIG